MNSTILGLLVGAFIGAIYVIHHWIKKGRAEFTEVVVILLAAVALFDSAELAYHAIIENDEYLCALANQRVVIVLGTLVVFWESIKALLNIFEIKIIKNKTNV